MKTEKLAWKTEKILNKRLNKDKIIALATIQNGMPYVRNVNGCYEDRSLNVITYTISINTKQVENIQIWHKNY